MRRAFHACFRSCPFRSLATPQAIGLNSARLHNSNWAATGLRGDMPMNASTALYFAAPPPMCALSLPHHSQLKHCHAAVTTAAASIATVSSRCLTARKQTQHNKQNTNLQHCHVSQTRALQQHSVHIHLRSAAQTPACQALPRRVSLAPRGCRPAPSSVLSLSVYNTNTHSTASTPFGRSWSHIDRSWSRIDRSWSPINRSDCITYDRISASAVFVAAVFVCCSTRLTLCTNSAGRHPAQEDLGGNDGEALSNTSN